MSGVAQATIWAPELSNDKLAFYYDGATAVKGCEQGAPDNPAACVAVPCGAARGFAVAAVVDTMPRVDGWLSFGVGRTVAKERERFGSAGGTCGLQQNAGGSASAAGCSHGEVTSGE